MLRRLLDVWPPLPPGALLRPAAARLPFPLHDGRASRYARARQALWHTLPALGLEPGDVVLVPAYHHGSEVETLSRRGLVPRWYGEAGAAPDPDELEPLLDGGVKALYLTHTLGLPQDAAAWRAWCDERGLLLVEDAAQAWLAHRDRIPVGSHGDLAVFCLYKTYGLPDGAVATARVALPPEPAPGGLAASGLARRTLSWLRQRLPTPDRLGPPALSYDAARDMGLFGGQHGMSRTALHLLPRLAGDDAAGQRRAHYRRLLADLEPSVPPAFRTLASGASPFAFPVAFPDKEGALALLRAQGVRAASLWSVPHPSLPIGRFPTIDLLRAQVVGLPVHQELEPRDLDHLAAAARRAGAKTT